MSFDHELVDMLGAKTAALCAVASGGTREEFERQRADVLMFIDSIANNADSSAAKRALAAIPYGAVEEVVAEASIPLTMAIAELLPD